MKSFDIITETDARTLEPGSSVTLKPGGHVTPLAADTLRARRITVLSGVAEASLDGLITHTEPCERAPEAYATAFGDAACLKMILDWSACA